MTVAILSTGSSHMDVNIIVSEEILNPAEPPIESPKTQPSSKSEYYI